MTVQLQAPGATRPTPATRTAAAGLTRRAAGRATGPGVAALRMVAPLALAAAVTAGWELVARSGAVPATILPPPSAVAARLVEDLTSGGLLTYTAPTLTVALLGCLLGAAVALPLGYLVFRSRTAAAALEPFIAASQAIPAVALAPLLVIWVGYGLLPGAVLSALLVFFPIVIATVHGLRSLDPDVVAAARLDGAGGRHLLTAIEFPLALPSLLAGLRNGFTLSVTGAIVGEFVMGGEGLGMVLAGRGRAADVDGLFSALVVLGVLAMSIYALIRALERRLADR